MKEFGWDDSLGFTIKKNAMYQDKIFENDRRWKIMDFFIHKASTIDRISRTKYGDIQLSRGQFIFSFRQFSKWLSMHQTTLFDNLKWFRDNGYLEIEDRGRFSIISLNLSMIYNPTVKEDVNPNTTRTVKETINNDLEVIDSEWIYDLDDKKFIFVDPPAPELDNYKDNITNNNTNSIIKEDGKSKKSKTKENVPSEPSSSVVGSRDVLLYFLSSWSRKYKTKYPVNFKKDGFLAKKILELCGTAERAIEMVDVYLEDSDKWVSNMRHPLGILLNNAPKYVTLLTENHQEPDVPAVDKTPGSEYIGYDEAYNEAHAEPLLEYFYLRWRSEFHRPYPFDKEGDHRAARIILDKYGFPRALELVRVYVGWTDKYVEEAGHPIQLLVQNMDKIDAEIKSWYK